MLKRISEMLRTYFKLDENKTPVHPKILAGFTQTASLWALTGKARKIKSLAVIVALIFVGRYTCMTLG
jgi:xanthine/uracil/vitamin C permease (AzgA family)